MTYCSECGAKVEVGARFCADCGKPVESTTATSSGRARVSQKPGKLVLALILVLILAAIGLIAVLSPRFIPTEKNVGEVRGNTVGNINNLGIAAHEDDWFYYVSYDGFKLYKVRTDDSEIISVNNDISLFINVVNGWIYYSTEDKDDDYSNKIYKIRTDGSDRTQVNDDESSFINVVNDWIYYCNGYFPGGPIYKIRTDGSNKTRVNDDNSGLINVIGEWIYYCNIDDSGKIYKIRTDGSNKTRVNNEASWYINVVGECIYYCNLEDDGKIYKIRTDGSNKIRVNDDNSGFLNVVDDWIYYCNLEDDGKIYKIRADGSDRTKLNDDFSSYINVVGNWIYYCDDWGNWEKIYRIRIDGSDRQLVTGIDDNTKEIEEGPGEAVYILLEALENGDQRITNTVIIQAVEVIRTRLIDFGIAEPVIAIEGGNQIRVEIPRIDNLEKAREIIGRTAFLSLVGPDGIEIVTVANLKRASMERDPSGQNPYPYVSLEFDQEGTKLLVAAKKKYLGQSISIILDGEVIVTTLIEKSIDDGKMEIIANFTAEEAFYLALLLRSGPLPVGLRELESRIIESE